MSNIKMINIKSSDIEIIKSILNGNDIHFKFLIDKYKTKGYALAYRMIKNKFDAEEILQDSFIKVYKSLGHFRNESKFSTYLYRIIYNCTVSFIRNNKKYNIEDSTEELNEEHYKASNLYEQKDLNEFVNKIINDLPLKYSVILTLFYINELSLDEICELTGESLSAVKVKLFRGRNLLKDLIIKNNYTKELI